MKYTLKMSEMKKKAAKAKIPKEAKCFVLFLLFA